MRHVSKPAFMLGKIMTFDHTLYLDFDGVLNAVEPQHDKVENFVIKIENSLNFLPETFIVYSPNVVETLERLREQYKMELVWLTTWNENNTVLRLAEHLKGLDHGRVLPANLHTAKVGKREWTQWKAEAILEDQKASERPFIWVDDNAHKYWGEAVNEGTEASSLFVTPNSTWGLTKNNLDKMEQFLSQN